MLVVSIGERKIGERVTELLDRYSLVQTVDFIVQVEG